MQPAATDKVPPGYVHNIGDKENPDPLFSASLMAVIHRLQHWSPSTEIPPAQGPKISEVSEFGEQEKISPVIRPQVSESSSVVPPSSSTLLKGEELSNFPPSTEVDKFGKTTPPYI